MQRRSRRCCRRRSPRRFSRQLGDRRHRHARAFRARRSPAAVARAGRMAAAGHRLARLHLRRGDGRRRRAHRNRSGDDGVAGLPRAVSASARSSTSTAGSAASISSGRGRAGSSPAAALRRHPRFDTAAVTGPTLSGHAPALSLLGIQVVARDPRNSLGALEREVMSVVWKRAKSTSAKPARG